MLVLMRKESETIVLQTSDGPVTVVINRVKGSRVSVGVKAPMSVKVIRGELQGKKP